MTIESPSQIVFRGNTVESTRGAMATLMQLLVNSPQKGGESPRSRLRKVSSRRTLFGAGKRLVSLRRYDNPHT